MSHPNDDNCRRLPKPWEDLVWPDDYERLKAAHFAAMEWWFDLRTGNIGEHSWEMVKTTTGDIVRGPLRSNFDHTIANLTKDDVDAIYETCRRTDCTVAEAAIKFAGGADKLAPEWIRQAMVAPATRYKYATSYLQRVRVEEEAKKPVKDYVDPEPDGDPEASEGDTEVLATAPVFRRRGRPPKLQPATP